MTSMKEDGEAAVKEDSEAVVKKEEGKNLTKKQAGLLPIRNSLQSKPCALGRKGLRKMGRTDNYKGCDQDSTGFVGGQANMQLRLEKEGFGLSIEGGFPKNCVAEFCCAEIKTERIVLPSAHTPEGDRKQEVMSWNVFKLASPSQNSVAPTKCFNPFMQGMPFGDTEPLPR